MNNTTSSVFITMPQQKKVRLEPKAVRKLARISAQLADTMEDVLESQGVYKEEFLKGLNGALRQTRNGKVKKINSLKEL